MGLGWDFAFPFREGRRGDEKVSVEYPLRGRNQGNKEFFLTIFSLINAVLTRKMWN